MLRYNDQEHTFLLYTNDKKRAAEAGLSLSTSHRGPAGEFCFYTSSMYDHAAPDYNPYAVLEFFDEADEAAKGKLIGLHKDYKDSWRQTTSFVAPHPPTKEPMLFQNAGVEYCLGRAHSIIGDEMGLGKTVQAILLANAMDARRVLVVCPASIRRQWVSEIYEWSTMMRPYTQAILKGSDGVRPDAKWTVVSYDLLRNKGIHAALRAISFDLVIYDEGHYLKTPDAKRTQAIFGGGEYRDNHLSLNAERMVALTGTPLPLDWASIDYLSYDNFLFRYNPSHQEWVVDPITGEERMKTHEERGRLAELNARLRSNIMARRLAQDVLTQLPDKRYEMTYIEPDGAIKDVLAREALIDFDPRELFNPDFTLDGTPISTLRREMGEAMVPSIIRYVKDVLEITEVPKILLFAHHTSVIMALAEALSKYGVSIHKGGMNTTKKEAAKSDFIAGLKRIFLGQLDTMEGVDGLQSVARLAIFAEPAWTSGRNEQCVGRLFRHGQHDNVLAQFLLVEGSFNEKVLNLVLGKAGTIHASLDRRLV